MLVVAIVVGLVLVVVNRLSGREDVYYGKGELYLSSGNSAEAVKYLRLALELNPTRPEVHAALARALAAQKDFKGALDELEEAARHGMDPAEGAMQLARIFSYRADYRIDTAESQQPAELADNLGVILEADVDEAIKLASDNAEYTQRPASAWFTLGRFYAQKSRVQVRQYRLLLEERALAGNLRDEQRGADAAQGASEMAPRIARTQRNEMAAYARATELDPNLPEPRLAAAEFHLGKYVADPAKAKKMLEGLSTERPDDTEARLMLLAHAEALLGNFDAALAHVRTLKTGEGDRFDLLLTETQLLVMAERWEEAGPASQTLANQRPNHPLVSYLRGETLLHQARGMPEGSEQRVERAREAAICLQRGFTGRARQASPQARFALAEALDEADSTEQATTAYGDVLVDLRGLKIGRAAQWSDLRDVDYRACLALARRLGPEQAAQALSYLRRAHRLLPFEVEPIDVAIDPARLVPTDEDHQAEVTGLVLSHASAVAGFGDPRVAHQLCLDELDRLEGLGLARTPEPRMVREFMVRLLSRAGSYADAADVLAELRKEFPGQPSYARDQVKLYEKLRRFDDVQAVCRELLQANPEDIFAMGHLLAVLAAADDREGIDELLAQVEKTASPALARALLVNLASQEGRVEQAAQVASVLAATYPDDATVQAAQADALWNVGDMQGARDAFDRALAIAPASPFANRRGLLDLAEGRTEEAAKLLANARETLPGNGLMAEASVVAKQADGDLPGALALAEDLMDDETMPALTRGLMRWYLAIMRAQEGDAEAAQALNQQVPMNDLGLRSDRAELLAAVAEAEPGVRDEAAVALGLLQLFLRANAQRAAVRQIEIVERLLPQEPLPRCWRALVLGRLGRRAQALTVCDDVLADRPDFVFAAMLAADLHLADGNGDLAIRALEEALTRVPEEATPVIHYRLGHVYELVGNLESAAASYRLAMEDPTVEVFAANDYALMLAVRAGDPEAALPIAKRALRALRALRVGGSLPQVLDTAGWVYYLNGNYADAVRYLELARRRMPQSAEVRYHLGMAYRDSELPDQAKAELEYALKLSPRFDGAEAAAEALRELSP